MDDRVKYLIFCMETYKQMRNMTGVQVYNHFKKYNFYEYIIDLYELFHSRHKTVVGRIGRVSICPG